MKLPKEENPPNVNGFKIKIKSDGTFDKYKVRLVSKGYTRNPSIDYENN